MLPRSSGTSTLKMDSTVHFRRAGAFIPNYTLLPNVTVRLIISPLCIGEVRGSHLPCRQVLAHHFTFDEDCFLSHWSEFFSHSLLSFCLDVGDRREWDATNRYLNIINVLMCDFIVSRCEFQLYLSSSVHVAKHVKYRIWKNQLDVTGIDVYSR